MLKWSYERQQGEDRKGKNIELVMLQSSFSNFDTDFTEMIPDDQMKKTSSLSKWRKVNNSIKFISISKSCVGKSKLKKKPSRWTIIRIAFSMVNFLGKS